MYLSLQRSFALILLFLTLPIFVLIWVAIKLGDGGALIFKQKRMGMGGGGFSLYKFRTMVAGSEKLKRNYTRLNEADGPVFKIYNDPRYTKVGKFLAHTGLDELPQLINIIKGEMVFVGPRPLPTAEANDVPKKYHARFKILPGVTSNWVVAGAHELSFKKWMELDLSYVKNRSFWLDLKISIQTLDLIIRSVFEQARSII